MSGEILAGLFEGPQYSHFLRYFLQQGASGVGFGNFEEVGPLYTNLTKRDSTWVKLVHLLFVVNYSSQVIVHFLCGWI